MLITIQRSVAEVEWSKGGKKNVYRIGHKGKVCKSISIGSIVRRSLPPSIHPSILFHLSIYLLYLLIYQIDIKAVTPGEGGFYYPDHLPVLGKPVEESPTEEKADVASGDLVRVQLEVDVFKAMQQGHGGWNDQMVEVQRSFICLHVSCVQLLVDCPSGYCSECS